MVIRSYEPTMKGEWDRFVESSRQRSFLLTRDYMDYHSDRFADESIMAYSDSGKLLAMLPANRDGDTLWSHQGLTYGGWITLVSGFDAAAMLEVWHAAAGFYRASGVRDVYYKPVPWLYHVVPAEEDLYALFRAGAEMVGCGVSSVIRLDSPLPFNENSRRNLKKAQRAGLVVDEAAGFGPFWRILTDVLALRHGCAPVHSLNEIELLASRFPDNIRLYTVSGRGGELLGGTVVYVTETVAHLQYIAASEAGRECGALACLFAELIRRFQSLMPAVRYLDFGISTEQSGRVLNEGLHRQKSGFGGRAVVYPMYHLTL